MVTDNMPLFGLNLTLVVFRDASNNNLGGSDIPYNLPPNLQSLWVMYSCFVLYVYLIIPIYVLIFLLRSYIELPGMQKSWRK